tara:strand:+ start:279 stop:431 length:153 start_codon:yes stop_codon:yes gene_type:complete
MVQQGVLITLLIYLEVVEEGNHVEEENHVEEGNRVEKEGNHVEESVVVNI